MSSPHKLCADQYHPAQSGNIRRDKTQFAGCCNKLQEVYLGHSWAWRTLRRNNATSSLVTFQLLEHPTVFGGNLLDDRALEISG